MNEAFGTVDCAHCVNRELCGTHSSAGLWGCYDYCHDVCKGECDYTCPNNEPTYSERMVEVGGLSLDRIGPLIPARLGAPTYLSVVRARTAREGVASLDWAAVPLVAMFRASDRDEISPIASTPQELRRRFGLRSDARIIGCGVGPDRGLEWFWRHFRTAPLAKWLREMGVDAITAPNFSHFAFVPRDQFLWNRKRMYLFCQELAKDGFPVIPHLYGDSIFDWSFSAQIFREHRLLDSFAMEFQTDDGNLMRREEVLDHLRRFRDNVARPLTLVAIGARQLTEHLASIFPSLVVVESSAYMKTVHRQLAEVKQTGGLKYSTIDIDGPLDGLLEHNNRIIRGWIDAAAARGRARMARIETARGRSQIPSAPEILNSP